MGGLDYRLPIFVMTISALKSVLNQKAAEASKNNPAPLASPQMTQPTNGPSTHAPASQTVTLSFSMALEDVAGFLERVQSLLPVQATIKPAVALPPAAASAPLQSKEQPRPAPTEKISDKQTAMIMTLCRRKRLTAEQMTDLLQEQFGVKDGSQLDKKQASRLIDMLMAI